MTSKYLFIAMSFLLNHGCRTDIKTITYTSASLFRGKQISERGRVQIWNPKRLECPQLVNGPVDSSLHRRSVTTMSTVPSLAPSMGKSFLISPKSALSENVMGFSFEMPGLPILVFYLRSDNSDKEEMSFLSIESKLGKL